MGLWKQVICVEGHIHEVYCVGDPVAPYPCLQISRLVFTKDEESGKLKKSQKHNTHNTLKEKREMKTNHELHSDTRPTVVLINNKVYDLVPSEWDKESLLKAQPKTRPHVRLLNPIPDRTKLQQEAKNSEEEFIHKLYTQIPVASTPIAKAKQQISKGGSTHETEINKLLELKEKAQKAGDQKEARRIRQALRKLDHKRYTQK